MNTPPERQRNQPPAAQSKASQAGPGQSSARGATSNKHTTISGTILSKATLIRVVLAILLATAGAVAGEFVKSAWPSIWAKLVPSPYAYLEGRYKGQWDWTDPTTHVLTNTMDTVYFQSTMNGQLIGRGDDPHLGTYSFTGNLYGNTIDAGYRSDTGSAEPAQSGGFHLHSTSTNPLVLEGTWTGFMNGQEVQGNAKLTKLDDAEN